MPIKLVISFLLLLAFSGQASSELRILRISQVGEPRTFRFFAEQSAKRRVRHDCTISGGSVVAGSAFITHCYQGQSSKVYQCHASCDCAYGGSRAGR